MSSNSGMIKTYRQMSISHSIECRRCSNYIFIIYSMNWAKATARRVEKFQVLEFGAAYIRDFTVSVIKALQYKLKFVLLILFRVHVVKSRWNQFTHWPPGDVVIFKGYSPNRWAQLFFGEYHRNSRKRSQDWFSWWLGAVSLVSPIYLKDCAQMIIS